jgi:hypothetical protein
VYRACAPSLSRAAPESRGERQELPGLELFQEPVVRTYPWSVEYSTDQYIALLSTYSDHISLPDAERDALYRGIAALIREEYGGNVLKHYQAVLTVWKIRE